MSDQESEVNHRGVWREQVAQLFANSDLFSILASFLPHRSRGHGGGVRAGSTGRARGRRSTHGVSACSWTPRRA